MPELESLRLSSERAKRLREERMKAYAGFSLAGEEVQQFIRSELPVLIGPRTPAGARRRKLAGPGSALSCARPTTRLRSSELSNRVPSACRSGEIRVTDATIFCVILRCSPPALSTKLSWRTESKTW